MLVFILGLILTQIINIYLQYRRKGNAEYLRYTVYLFVFLVYLVLLNFEILFPKQATDKSIVSFAGYINRPIAILLYILYNRFTIAFLDLKTKYVSLYKKFFAFNIYLFATFIFTFFTQYFINPQSEFGKGLFVYFSLAVFAVSVYLFFKIWRIRTKLSSFIITGSMCLTIGVFITNILNYFVLNNQLHIGIYYLLPLFLGLALEIYFFNTGLSYKTKLMETDLINTQQLLINEMKAKEKIMTENENIRDKIARDLHDNIGATLSSIAIYSKVAHVKADEKKSKELTDILDKIISTSTNMVTEMNDTIWSILPKNDDIEHILLKMQSFAKPLLASRNIKLDFSYAEDLKKINLNMEKRKNLFLIFKEAINNAVKYSAAKTVTTTLQLHANILLLQIKDDGIGFDTTAELYKYENKIIGNGILNMKTRAEEIGAKLTLASKPQQGTVIELAIKIP
jgi:signal transduction histidine kinase